MTGVADITFYLSRERLLALEASVDAAVRTDPLGKRVNVVFAVLVGSRLIATGRARGVRGRIGGKQGRILAVFASPNCMFRQ